MNRKWRTNHGAFDTVLPFHEFSKRVHPWREGYSLATLTDLYAVYTVLHIESKEWQIEWSEGGQFYYFLATETLEHDQAPAAAAPEGDEDYPDMLVVEDDDDNGGGDVMPKSSPPLRRKPLGKEQEQGEAGPLDQPPATVDGPAPTGDTEATVPRTRRQLIVPVSSASGEITPKLLQRLFAVRGVQVQQLLLGLVDSHGVVSRCCMYNYIQAPLEGPGTANLELNDD